MMDVLTVPDFAKRLKLSPASVYLAIQEKRVNAVRILGRIVIPRSELQKVKRRNNGVATWVLRKKKAVRK